MQEGKLVDVISKLGLQKSSVIQHMTSVIQPILEKGILDYSIIHTALVEYFTIADKSSAADVIQQLSPLLVQESSGIEEGPHSSKKRKNKKNRTKVPLLVRMISTRDGLKLGILCIKHGSAKDRKKIIKGIKDHIRKLALDRYGSLLLTCIASVVDDTKLVSKIVIQQLKSMLKELLLDRNGRFPLLQLLHPQCLRYLGPEDLACLNLSVPSLCSKGEAEETISGTGSEKDADLGVENLQLTMGGKKDPSLRSRELLVESGLAEALIDTCIENVNELLMSNFGKEVIFEVAVGGTNGVLKPLAERLDTLHKAIADLAALPKTADGSEENEHVFENFHSSRTIRKLVLDSPSFAATLWKVALKGKCEVWAHGHSGKVVAAFLESNDPKVRDLAKAELQPLVDHGVLKSHDSKQVKPDS
ncbi:pumilio-like protein 24 [Iris pallida]|uniref:Pumilio-like protein 24 n=1 Tax=Iris pallida TaxID=29817 RepID=A0AAX6FK40_IRIPA|nr:pumilio-like protein 24 [Iris pallida]